MAVELASPLFPRAFLALACLGSVARAVTGVAGGATRAALTLHFARARNAADIAAKEGSQVRGLDVGVDVGGWAGVCVCMCLLAGEVQCEAQWLEAGALLPAAARHPLRQAVAPVHAAWQPP